MGYTRKINHMKYALLFGILLLTTSCVAVKEYEKVYINAEDMALSARGICKADINSHIYREGAAGANGGKMGGGCGCN
jgi:hypothetical protein